MGYELREGQGTLHKNDKQNEKQPDYTGTFLLNGTVYKIAGWLKDKRDGSGKKYMSLKVEEKQQGGQAAPVGNRVAANSGASSFDKDDLPF